MLGFLVYSPVLIPARQDPAVVDAFAEIWGTKELVVSYGEFNSFHPTIAHSQMVSTSPSLCPTGQPRTLRRGNTSTNPP